MEERKCGRERRGSDGGEREMQREGVMKREGVMGRGGGVR